MKRYASKLLLVLACFTIGAGVMLYNYSRQPLVVMPPSPIITTQNSPQETVATTTTMPAADDSATANAVSGRPVALSIPELRLRVAIAPGVYDPESKQWTLSKTTAHYATMTPEANTTGGNTFIYGHNRKGIFASLHKMSSNSKVYVTTANGKTFVYRLTGRTTVTPENSGDIFSYRGAPKMTVQTCTGLFYEKRELFTFALESAA